MITKQLIHCLACSLITLGLGSTSHYTTAETPDLKQAQTGSELSSTHASRISINSANADALANHLIGVSTSKAQAIVAWRTQNGRFTNIEQLLKVKGIGAITLNKNKHLIAL